MKFLSVAEETESTETRVEAGKAGGWSSHPGKRPGTETIEGSSGDGEK